MKKFKTVIVTGGYGFIGSNLVKYLIKKNYFVINIDKLSYSANLYNSGQPAKRNSTNFDIYFSRDGRRHVQNFVQK